MLPNEPRDGRPDGGFLGAKELLYGACGLIVILAGIAWGATNSNHASEVDDLKSVTGKQWEGLRALNDALIRLESDVEQNRRYIDDQEERIRALEHRGDRR